MPPASRSVRQIANRVFRSNRCLPGGQWPSSFCAAPGDRTAPGAWLSWSPSKTSFGNSERRLCTSLRKDAGRLSILKNTWKSTRSRFRCCWMKIVQSRNRTVFTIGSAWMRSTSRGPQLSWWVKTVWFNTFTSDQARLTDRRSKKYCVQSTETESRQLRDVPAAGTLQIQFSTP